MQTASSQGSGELRLLPRRLAALGLDTYEIARLEPLAFLELDRRCWACEAKAQCAEDLTYADSAREGWAAYCLNAPTLRALSEIPWFRPATSEDIGRRV